ncbi:hypothetical protein PN36_00720 [Candidatus Thiomargarita nelsonii]|uniref:PIN domain-containing protein n=1 Tax=Candidatus Thiomargarita nelsonii TaxID=1003181 RepID=A0A0A6P9Y1_9GAMM|nr:hypothetical protein PN36_00720 [Candidatus Thiomargarita nelsonii]
MNDKYFFMDTNVVIYSLSNIVAKKKRAIELLSTKKAVISTQIISESVNVMSRKLKYDYSQIRRLTDKFVEKTTLHPITHDTIRMAFSIAEKYGYAYYDSQVIASALEHDCAILYSEDFQHEQLIENRLKIVNPFVKE